MSGIYKTGIVKSSAFNESEIANLNTFTSGGYTPTATTNSCIQSNISGFQKGGKYRVEFLLTWSGFTTDTSSSFNAFFQGSAYTGGEWSWTVGNPMTTAINNNALKGIVLGAASGSKFISEEFTVTGDTTALGFGMRFDNANGTGTVNYSNLSVSAVQSFVSSKNEGGKICNTKMIMNDFIEV